MEIKQLTKEYAQANASEILSLEHNWTEIGDKPWTLENLMYELPSKWILSNVAIEENKIIGYQIGSIRGDVSYLNKILVDRIARSAGAGRALLRPFLQKSLDLGILRVQFKVRVDNPATKFYSKLGFRGEIEDSPSRPDGIRSYIYDTLISNVIQNV